ncbi:MAG: hypothetical protein KGY99_06085 [Phycisphaerae bacterium]|nr:hypothetical protein [Phycisphaerae bacterium]
MTTLDGDTLFASGPHAVRVPSWPRRQQRRALSGLDGELVLDMGLRSRELVQTGRLAAATAEDIRIRIDAIVARIDGRTHTLTDALGRTFSRVLVESFEPSAPVRRGRAFWCDYTLTYRQLP